MPEGWISIDQLMDMPEPEYLIEGVLPKYGVGHLVGASSGGKTFIALHIAMTLARGDDNWLGFPTSGEQHRVAYIAMEGGFDLGQRVQAWMQMYGAVNSENIRFLVEQPFDLMTADAAEALKGLQDFHPSVLFIDTQSLAAPKADENDNASMTALMSTVKLISQAYGCLVILVHHAGHSNDRARGASAQYANMDVSFFVKAGKEHTDPRTLIVDKLKSGLPPDPIHFQLVESGNSVVVHRVDPIEEMISENPDVFAPTTTQQKILAYLIERMEDPGRTNSASRSQISKGTDLAPTTVRRNLAVLMSDRAMQVRQVQEGIPENNLPALFEYWQTDNVVPLPTPATDEEE